MLVRVGALLLWLAAATVSAAQELTLETVLGRLHDYLTKYGELLPAAVAVEHYEQHIGITQRVTLESDFGIVRVPNHPQWLGFRDVVKVDGKPVRGRERRLAALFENAALDSIDQARRIALESTRFNIGRVARTINDPAVVLEVLDPRNAHRLRFQKERVERLGETAAWVVRFREIATPTIVRTASLRDVPSTGRAWIDPSTGRLLRAKIATDGVWASGRVNCEVDVTFSGTSGVDFWVPSRMVESCFDGTSLQEGEATYGNYRLFGVQTGESFRHTP